MSRFCQPDELKNYGDFLSTKEKAMRDALTSDNGKTHYRTLLDEQRLVDAGISHNPPEGNFYHLLVIYGDHSCSKLDLVVSLFQRLRPLMLSMTS